MKKLVSFFAWVAGQCAKLTKKPWATFEIDDIDENGRVKFKFSWNDAIIERLNAMGFRGINEEETMQLFFLTSQIRPENLDDNVVNPAEMPMLTHESNTLRK